MPEQALVVTLNFDPFTLPTAQHRAGLAGLLVHQETMRRRGMGPLMETAEDSEGRWTVAFTEESLRTAFDDLYDAAIEERSQKQKRTTGKGESKTTLPPKREELRPDPAKNRQVTEYVYDQVVPRAQFLTALGVPEPWVKLWREAMWQGIRNISQTRLPYVERARRKSSSVSKKYWASLSRPANSRSKRAASPLSGSLQLGAQGDHGDNIPFLDLFRQTFLLHFWPVVMGTFVPLTVDRKGNQEYNGFALTIPDVADMAFFRDDFIDAAALLSSEVAGYRPRNSLVAIPAEAGLAYGSALAAIARARARGSETGYSLAAIEVFHLGAAGRAPTLLHAGRVNMDADTLNDYDIIRQEARDPLFLRQRVLNLLVGRPWYVGFDAVFAQAPHKHFVGGAWKFGGDVRRTLRRLEVKVND